MSDRSERAEPSARFAAFDSWNFRVYFAGQSLSTIGTWMQALAQAWLVLELTDRSDRLGITVALQFAPLLVFGALAGVLADRFENRCLLIITSALSGLLSLALGIVVAGDRVTIWWIYGFALVYGFVMAVERPTMQAVVFQLVGRDRLPSAIGIGRTRGALSRSFRQRSACAYSIRDGSRLWVVSRSEHPGGCRLCRVHDGEQNGVAARHRASDARSCDEPSSGRMAGHHADRRALHGLAHRGDVTSRTVLPGGNRRHDVRDRDHRPAVWSASHTR